MGDADPVELLRSRSDFLEQLADEPLRKPELVDRLDVSRSTVDRAINGLEAAGLVERGADGYVATLAGRLAAERHREYRRGVTAVFDAAEFLDSLPVECDLPVDALVGAEWYEASGPAPYEPLEVLYGTISDADEYRALLPALEDPRHLQLCYEHVVTEENTASLVVGETLFETLRTEFPRQLAVQADHEGFTIRTGDLPPYGLVLTTHDGERTATGIVYTEEGNSIRAVVQNDTAAAAEWAGDRFEAAADRATDVSGALAADGAGGADATSTVLGPSGRLPVPLETEGFVRLTPWLFANRRSGSPETAWRAGLGLAEVQSGYAVERTTEIDGDRRSLSGVVLDRLRAGSHCALIGLPGSGKSTVCKRVACEWYRGGDPVFYRESGRGQPFESVDALLAAVASADGRPLVVVEDAVRPEANAVFDALADLGDEAVVLLDAREGEWHDQSVEFDPDVAARRHGVETVTMPALSAADCERLLERFEGTVGRSVDVPAETLRAEIRDESRSTGTEAPGEVLLLLHRLSLYADPEAENTTLEEHVARTRTDLAAAGDVAEAAGTLANLLNAAGIEPRESYLHAVADPGEHRAVEEAIDLLEGRLLFRTDGGRYRTVHEEWSVAYLDELLAAEDAAAERVCDCLGALLGLADDPERRERIAADWADDPGVVSGIGEAPGDWADDIVEAVFSLVADRRPNLTPLLGSVAGPDVALPSACSAETRLRRLYRRGNGYKLIGRLDRADEEFRRMAATVEDAGSVPATDRRELRALALVGQGTVATNRGSFGAAEDQFESALDLYSQAGNRYGRALCLDRLARIAGERGDFERLEEYCEEAADTAADLGATGLRSSVKNNLGLGAWTQGDLETASAHLRESLELSRSINSRQDEAFAIGNLGLLARERGDFDEATEYFERALALREELNVTPDIALTHWNLGEIARRRGDLDAADRHLQKALSLYREIGDEVGIARSRVVLGETAFDRGDLGAAEEHASGALERLEAADELLDRAGALILLAGINRERDDLGAAEDRLDTARDLCDRADSYQGRIWCLTERGRIERRRGNDEAAEDRLRRALELARDNDYVYDEAVALAALGDLEMARDRPAAAREHLEAAADRHRRCGAAPKAAEVIDSLVAACEADDDEPAARRWAEVAADLREQADSRVR